MKHFKFFPIWITAVFFLLFTTFGNTAEYRSTRKPATGVKRKIAASPKRNTSTENSDINEHKFNARIGLYDLFASSGSLLMFTGGLDYGFFNDAMTIGPSIGFKSLVSTSTVSMSYFLISGRVNYYLNKLRYTNGFLLTGELGLASTSTTTKTPATPFTPATETSASSSDIFLKAMGGYQYWFHDQGIADLNVTASGGLTLMGSIALTIELGVGYRF